MNRIAIILAVALVALVGCATNQPTPTSGRAPGPTGPPGPPNFPSGPGPVGLQRANPDDEMIAFEVMSVDEDATTKWLQDNGIAYRYQHHDDRTDVIVKVNDSRHAQTLESKPGRMFNIYTGGRHGKSPFPNQ